MCDIRAIIQDLVSSKNELEKLDMLRMLLFFIDTQSVNAIKHIYDAVDCMSSQAASQNAEESISTAIPEAARIDKDKLKERKQLKKKHRGESQEASTCYMILLAPHSLCNVLRSCQRTFFFFFFLRFRTWI